MEEQIIHAEEKWLLELAEHCRELFSGVFLPSHDHRHHIRVWNFACEILLAMDETGIPIPAELPEQLIIACLYHDVGLTVTRGEKHGAESVRLLKKLGPLKFQHLKVQPLFHAIEHHDDKSYSEGGNRDDMPGLPEVLSGADDLDALGAIGVYRYAEIYLLRGIPGKELPGRVLDNLNGRMRMLKRIFGRLPGFMERHAKRYDVTRDFYMGIQGNLPHSGPDHPVRDQVIDLIRFSLENRINLMDPGVKIADMSPGIVSFLDLLHAEVT